MAKSGQEGPDSMVVPAGDKAAGDKSRNRLTWVAIAAIIVIGVIIEKRNVVAPKSDQVAQVSSESIWDRWFDRSSEPTSPEDKGAKTENSFLSDFEYLSAFGSFGNYKNLQPNPELVARGDLNKDGEEDIVVVLTEKQDKYVFWQLAVLIKKGDKYQNTRTLFLGDRTRVESIKIEGGEIKVGLLSHRSDDSLDNPTENQRLDAKIDPEKGWLMEYTN